jgi:hypothetical protein
MDQNFIKQSSNVYEHKKTLRTATELCKNVYVFSYGPNDPGSIPGQGKSRCSCPEFRPGLTSSQPNIQFLTRGSIPGDKVVGA